MRAEFWNEHHIQGAVRDGACVYVCPNCPLTGVSPRIIPVEKRPACGEKGKQSCQQTLEEISRREDSFFSPQG